MAGVPGQLLQLEALVSTHNNHRLVELQKQGKLGPSGEEGAAAAVLSLRSLAPGSSSGGGGEQQLLPPAGSIHVSTSPGRTRRRCR